MEWLADRTLKAGYAIAPAKALTAREIEDAVAGQVKNAGAPRQDRLHHPGAGRRLL